MFKLVMFDADTGDIIESKLGLESYDSSFNKVSYTEKVGTKGALTGINVPFIVVEEGKEPTLEEAWENVKELKIKTQLSKQCEQAILAGFSYSGYHFSFSYKDQDNFTQRLVLILLTELLNRTDIIPMVSWKTDKGPVNFTREEFIQICMAGELHKTRHITKYWALESMVRSTEYTDMRELEKINFSYA